MFEIVLIYYDELLILVLEINYCIDWDNESIYKKNMIWSLRERELKSIQEYSTHATRFQPNLTPSPTNAACLTSLSMKSFCQGNSRNLVLYKTIDTWFLRKQQELPLQLLRRLVSWVLTSELEEKKHAQQDKNGTVDD